MTLIVTGAVENCAVAMTAIPAVMIAMEVIAVVLVVAEESAFLGSGTIFKGN